MKKDNRTHKIFQITLPSELIPMIHHAAAKKGMTLDDFLCWLAERELRRRLGHGRENVSTDSV